MSSKANAELEKQVTELRHNAERLDWMKTSEASERILMFCIQGAKEDFFLRNSDRANPFREKKGSCSVL